MMISYTYMSNVKPFFTHRITHKRRQRRRIILMVNIISSYKINEYLYRKVWNFSLRLVVLPTRTKILTHIHRKTSFLILSNISWNVNFEHNHKRTPPTKAKSWYFTSPVIFTFIFWTYSSVHAWPTICISQSKIRLCAS